MVLGDLQFWSKQVLSADERILERIVSVWPACLKVLPGQPEEDIITINLVDLLNKDPVIRRICHWLEFQYEPFGTAPNGQKFSKGKIDLAVLLDWERERYIAYECKRLNVTYNGKRSSLAKAYVTDGMMRFMTEQYAEGLPVGCMLGYVMDGDAPFAIAQLTKAIKSHGPLNVTTGPSAIGALQNVARFLTVHDRNGGIPIELRHALLSFQNSREQ